MIKPSPNHLMLTRKSFAMKKLFPWSHSFQRILHHDRPKPLSGNHILCGSDYGGYHKSSKYYTYAYLLTDSSPTCWLEQITEIKREHLPDGRRMSFKRLNDNQRSAALIPYLQAAQHLTGHLVLFIVSKSINLHPTKRREDRNFWKNSFQLNSRWKSKPLSDLMIKAHLFGILAAQWSRPYMNVTWITDEDQFVANAGKLDEAQLLAARFATFYLNHTLGEFCMNTTLGAQDFEDERTHNTFEDYIAICDLAAGALSEICNGLSELNPALGLNQNRIHKTSLSWKSEIIYDWFLFNELGLRKTAIMMDTYGPKTMIFKLDYSSAMNFQSRK